MHRTALLLASAAVLAVVALVARGPAAPTAAPPRQTVSSSTSDALSLSAAASSARVTPGTSQVYAKVDLTAARAEGQAQRVPVNLAIAIDRSGSMNDGKLQQAITAATTLIDQLAEGDRLAIVAFDDGTQVFPSTVIDSDSRPRLRAFVTALREGGGTNIGSALQYGYAQVRPYTAEYRVSRVVLLSDGQPTVGLTSADQLVALAARAREDRVSTSAWGIGLDFNAALMKDLAGSGGGTYAFVENAANLGLAFAHELGEASQLLARDVKVTLKPAVGVVIEEVYGHAFTRVGDAVVVSLYDFAPRQTAQVLARLKVNAPQQGAVALAEATVSFVDVRKDVPATATAAVNATVGDAQQVQAAANADVVEMAKRVDMSTRVAEAQAAYQRGDTRSAFEMMTNLRTLFGMSADALAGTEAEVEGSWRQGGDAARRADMNLTKKTMKGFGQNNASAY